MKLIKIPISFPASQPLHHLVYKHLIFYPNHAVYIHSQIVIMVICRQILHIVYSVSIARNKYLCLILKQRFYLSLIWVNLFQVSTVQYFGLTEINIHFSLFIDIGFDQFEQRRQQLGLQRVERGLERVCSDMVSPANSTSQNTCITDVMNQEMGVGSYRFSIAWSRIIYTK